MQWLHHSVRNRSTVYVLIVVIVVLGVRSYMTLPREAAPDITIPVVLITTSYEGAAPGDVESLITKPLERKLKGLADMKKMASTSSEGLSVISVEFQPDADIDFALQKVRDKVSEAKPDLPADLEDDSAVSEISFSQWPIINVIVAGDVGLERLKEVAEDLKDDIESIRGVLSASVVGGRERQVIAEFDLARLMAYHLTVGEIFQAVRENNVNMPSGSIDMGDGKFSVQVPGEFETPAEVGRLVIAVRDQRPVYLRDIAAVRFGFEDRTSFARFNGQECVTVSVTKRAGSNLMEITDAVKALVERYRERYAGILSFAITGDQSRDVDLMVSDLENNILSGMLLVLIVVFVGMGLRNALLVSTAIPLSALATFAVLQFMDVTLNMVVLFSLILVVGNLVDNAVVIVENTYRHHIEGKPLAAAAIDGAREVAWPVFSSTATNSAAFIPLLMWPGVMGEFMVYLPITVISAQVTSYLIAMVITPALCSLFVKAKPSDTGIDPWQRSLIITGYRALLGWALRHRLVVLVLFALAFWGSFQGLLWANVGIEFFPDTEPNRIMVRIRAPEGSNLYRTDELTRQVEAIVARYGNVRSYTAAVGAGAGASFGEGGSGNVNGATVYLDMVERELRRDHGDDGKIYFANSNDTLEHLRAALNDAIVGAEVQVEKERIGPPTGKPVNIEISGDDYAVLGALSQQLRRAIADTPGLVGLEDDLMTGLPELKVQVDKERAALFNLSAFSVGQMVKAAIGGLRIGKYREGEEEYDIVARLPAAERASINDLLRLHVPDPAGNPVPLSSLADVRLQSGLGAIRRINQQRVITVSGDAAKGTTGPEVLAIVRETAGALPLPAGYRLAYTGESEDMEESQLFLTNAFLIGLFMIMLILVTEFNSIPSVLIIMSTVVMSLIGVFISLIVTGRPFGIIMTGLGVISLAGVVVTNAIVLIDYTHLLHRQGRPMIQAIVDAGATRFRPVILTAISTMIGLIPTAMGVSFDFRKWAWSINGESAQWWGPMAIAFSYGLAIATLLTLIFVPVLISLAYDFNPWAKRAERERREMLGETATAAPDGGACQSRRQDCGDGGESLGGGS